MAVKDRAFKQPLAKAASTRWVAYTEAVPHGDSRECAGRRTCSRRTHAGGGRLLRHAFRRDARNRQCSASIRKTWRSRTRSRGGSPVVGGGSVYTAVENLLLACSSTKVSAACLQRCYANASPKCASCSQSPDPWYTAAAVPIGYPVGRGHGPLIRRPVEQLAYLDTWGKQFETKEKSNASFLNGCYRLYRLRHHS